MPTDFESNQKECDCIASVRLSILDTITGTWEEQGESKCIEYKTKQNKIMKKNHFTIEGTVALKKAFIEELRLTVPSEKSFTSWNYLTTNSASSSSNMYGTYDKEPLHFKIPQQWDEAVEYGKEFFAKEIEFKAGDYIVAENSGILGARKITECKVEENELVWNQEDDNFDSYSGYTHRWVLKEIRHATPEEIEEYNKPKLPVINGYLGKEDGDFLLYGCALLSKEWFKRTPNRNIKSITLSSGVEINEEKVEQIRKYLKLF